MKRKKLITRKIFLITAIMFLAYLIVTLLGQALFYEKFYTYTKRDMLSKQMDSFIREYTSLDNKDDINKAIVNYSNESDAYMMVINEHGEIIHSVSYELEVLTNDGQTLRISIDGAVNDKSFRNLNLRTGDIVNITYASQKTGNKDIIYMPVQISKFNKIWRMLQSKQEDVLLPPFDILKWQSGGRYGRSAHGPNYGNLYNQDNFENLEEQTVTVVSTTMPDKENSKKLLLRAECMMAAMQWSQRVFEGEKIDVGEKIHYVHENKNTGSKCVVVVTKFEVNNTTEMIVGVSTLETVKEAVSIMMRLQTVWFFLISIIVILITTIFSREITKPILNISEVTTKMKDLDFTQKCVVSSDDELGRLAMNINNMSDQLAKTIHELTAANAKLIDDIEKERRIENNRREFVAAVSHELKTPLAIIRAYSEALTDGVSEKKSERYLNVIVEETKKMDALVLDMLENSKLESGTQKLDIKRHDIKEILSMVANRFEHSCKEKEITLNTVYNAENTKRNFDYDKMEQLINNFITNAIHHTPKGGTITVSLIEDDEKLKVCVENTGSHIDEEVFDKIWDRFYKIDKSRERAVGGTGLGLSIAKNILVLHKADYGVENTKNGVMFWFELK